MSDSIAVGRASPAFVRLGGAVSPCFGGEDVAVGVVGEAEDRDVYQSEVVQRSGHSFLHMVRLALFRLAISPFPL